MSDSSETLDSKDIDEKLPKKVWPTRLNTKRYYVAILLLYAVVAFFSVIQPIKEYLDVNEALFTIPIDLLVAYVFLFGTIRYFWRAERARKGTWYEIERDRVVRKDGMLSKDFRDGVMNEELREDPILNVMSKSKHWRYHTREIPYTMIERVDLHQNLPERIMNIGNIKIDTGEDEIWMMRIPQARQTEELINRLVSKSTERYHRDRGYGPSPEPRTPDRAPARVSPERNKP